MTKGSMKIYQSKILFAVVIVLLSLFLTAIPLKVDAKTYMINESLESGDYFEVHEEVIEGRTISGNFSYSPEYPYPISFPVLRFFICNSENFQLWLDGQEFEKYHDWLYGVDNDDEFEVYARK